MYKENQRLLETQYFKRKCTSMNTWYCLPAGGAPQRGRFVVSVNRDTIFPIFHLVDPGSL